jgi:hypothetical protein
MEAVLWYVEGRQAENCLDRLQHLVHQMDSSGGLIKAVAGAEVGRGDCFVFITFWKAWDNVTRYLGGDKSDMLPKLGSPHSFEVVWEYPKEEVVAVRTGGHLLMYDVYADGEAENVLEHLRVGVGRLSHEAGFESAAIWIDRNNAGHFVLAAHWQAASVPNTGRVEECLMLESDKVRVQEKRVNTYRMQVLNAVSTATW